jgi:phage terminase small subunit
MEYKIESGKIIISAGVKPYKSPESLAKDSELRKEIPITLEVSIQNLPAEFDLSKLPRVILQRVVKSITIELQSLYRVSPVDKQDVSEYTKEYQKLQKTCTTIQKHDVGETVERKAGTKRSPADAKNAKYAEMLGIFLGKYEKFVKRDFSCLTEMHSATTADEVHEIGMKYATKWERELIAKK